MTPDEIAKLRAMCETVTQTLPWTVENRDHSSIVLDVYGMWVAGYGDAPYDAAYGAAAANALPALLDECERLRSALVEACEVTLALTDGPLSPLNPGFIRVTARIKELRKLMQP